MTSTRHPVAIAIAMLALLALLPVTDHLLPARYAFSSVLPQVFIYALVALGLQVVTGYAGILHLGVAAFMAIGTYTYAILTVPTYPLGWPPWLAIGAAVVVGAGAGLVLGLPTIRLRGDYLAIVTLGFGEIVRDALLNLDPLTKGSMGLNPLPRPGLPLIGGAGGHLPFYYLSLFLLAVATLAVWRLRRSRVGRSWLAVREDELAAQSMGIPVATAKLGALAAAAALCALGGALFAGKNGAVTPDGFDYQLSTMILCAVIIGGMGSLGGALLGSLLLFTFTLIILPLIPELLRAMKLEGAATAANPNNWKYAIFGLALVLMMRYRPQGLWREQPGTA